MVIKFYRHICLELSENDFFFLFFCFKLTLDIIDICLSLDHRQLLPISWSDLLIYVHWYRNQIHYPFSLSMIIAIKPFFVFMTPHHSLLIHILSPKLYSLLIIAIKPLIIYDWSSHHSLLTHILKCSICFLHIHF